MSGFIKKRFKRKSAKEEVKPIEIIPEVKQAKLTKELKVELQAKTEEIINQPNKPEAQEPKRPNAEKTINYQLLDNLISIFCTGEECAAVLDVDYDTLNSHIKKEYNLSFSEYFRKKNLKGKASLRRRQFQLTDKHPALAIWLGKQYLAQKDDPLIDQSIHYHYTQVNDTELIRRAKERGIAIPQEIERGMKIGITETASSHKDNES